MALTQQELQELKQYPANVPCNGCTACCKRDVIKLTPDESKRFPWHWEGQHMVLDRKPDGTCINLTAKGCGVHDNPPMICKHFDCRILFLTTPKSQRRIRIQQNPTMRAVYDAGKARANTLEKSTSA